MHNNPLGYTGATGEGIVTQESDDPGHVFDVRSSMSFFPIQDRRFVAADDFRHVDLPEVEVESSLANRLTDRPQIGRIAFYLGEVWAMEATHPM
jgi:hypothetical protein